MASTSALRLQPSPLSGPLSGYWKLAPERAFTVRPDEPGVLRVAHGRVWATLDGPHTGPANDWGDVVLHSGQEISLLPGQQLVLEPFGDAVNEPVFFSWEPRQPVAPAARPQTRHDPLARPQLESGAALGPMVAAVSWLIARVAAALSLLVAGRGRVLSPLETNQP